MLPPDAGAPAHRMERGLTQLQVAVVLPATWSDCRDVLGSPIVPTELREALDKAEEKHPTVEVHAVMDGSFEKQRLGGLPVLTTHLRDT